MNASLSYVPRDSLRCSSDMEINSLDDYFDKMSTRKGNIHNDESQIQSRDTSKPLSAYFIDKRAPCKIKNPVYKSILLLNKYLDIQV